MGNIKNGFLDGFSGRLGNVVGYCWRGRMCVRSMPSHYRDAQTPQQLQQRSQFKQVVRLASRAKRVLRVGLRQASLDAQMTETNYFMRINKLCFAVGTPSFGADEAPRRAAGSPAAGRAVSAGVALSEDEVPVYQGTLTIDYENLLLADGPVAPVAFDMPRLVDEVTLSVDFEKNPLRRVVHPDDLVYVAAYCPELGDFDLSEPAYRRSNRLTMSMNDYWVGREVHLWGFVADSKGRASRSQYLGCVVLSTEMVGNDAVGDSYDDLSLLLDNACSAQNGDAADAADDHLRGAHGGVVDLPDVGALGAGSSLGGAVP